MTDDRSARPACPRCGAAMRAVNPLDSATFSATGQSREASPKASATEFGARYACAACGPSGGPEVKHR